MTIPFTKLVSAEDKELTPVIQRAIGKFIRERGRLTYPHIPEHILEAQFRAHYGTEYHALALLITKELKQYVKTTTTNSGGGSPSSG